MRIFGIRMRTALKYSTFSFYIKGNILKIYRQPVGGGGQYLHPYYSGKPRNESIKNLKELT